MSDRVIFGTRNDTGTPANSSGFCGFPFRPTPGSASPSSTQFLAEWTFLRAIEEYWRIKEITFSVSIQITEGVAPDRTFYDLTGSSTVGIQFFHTRELDIVTVPLTGMWSPNGAVIPLTQSYENGDPDSTGNVTVSLTTDILHQPSAGAIEAGAGCDLFLAVNYPAGGTPISAGNANILGQTVPMWVASPTADTVVTGFSATISAAEYWPYAGRDGLPIYNTATGALLPGRTALS